MMVSLLPLRATHIPTVTTLLTKAFMSDIGMRTICCGTTEAHYRQSMATWFFATLCLHLATQQPAWVVGVDKVIVAAALLTSRHVSFGFRAWLGWVLTVGIRCGWGTVWRTAYHERQRAVYRPEQAHVVLEFIAVDTNHQGQGYAALLLDAAWKWSQTQTSSAGIWLETTRRQNVSFFEHFGYSMMGRKQLEQGEAFFLFRASD